MSFSLQSHMISAGSAVGRLSQQQSLQSDSTLASSSPEHIPGSPPCPGRSSRVPSDSQASCEETQQFPSSSCLLQVCPATLRIRVSADSSSVNTNPVPVSAVQPPPAEASPVSPSDIWMVGVLQSSAVWSAHCNRGSES
ncbi:hypothetical protein NQZ68_036308 [Dissostichus eleginoides]|nr:hypothetical protein NQZ68_036308 [Dissostichus eleginoides]